MSPTRPPRTATAGSTRAAGAGLALALVLVTTAACGSADTTSTASSSSSTPAPASTTSASGTSSTSADASPSTSVTSATSGTSAAAAAAAAAAMMTIKDYLFEVPASVKAGATVTVTNLDTEAPTVTSKQGGFNVKVNPRGATATFTAPSRPGKYPIDCDFHAQMNAVLVVS